MLNLKEFIIIQTIYDDALCYEQIRALIKMKFKNTVGLRSTLTWMWKHDLLILHMNATYSVSVDGKQQFNETLFYWRRYIQKSKKFNIKIPITINKFSLLN